MRTRNRLSAGILLVSASFSLSWALAQEASEEQTPSIDCPQLSATSTIEDRLEAIRECTGQDLGPITGFEPGTTLEHAERLYRDMKIYVALIEAQYDRQEEIIESLRAELEALQSEPQIAENR